MPEDDPRSGPSDKTRREFLRTTGSAAAATVMSAYVPAQANANVAESSSAATLESPPNIETTVPITLRVNGKDRQVRIDPRSTLLDCIRESVVLTGTKK